MSALNVFAPAQHISPSNPRASQTRDVNCPWLSKQPHSWNKDLASPFECFAGHAISQRHGPKLGFIAPFCAETFHAQVDFIGQVPLRCFSTNVFRANVIAVLMDRGFGSTVEDFLLSDEGARPVSVQRPTPTIKVGRDITSAARCTTSASAALRMALR